MPAGAVDAALVREFVIAGHGDLARVRALLAEHPALLTASHEWRPGDTETALQGAAHTGQTAVAEFLLERGAPLDICAAATLGRLSDVEALLREDPERVRARGAHGIPLLAHAAWSGSVPLAALLVRAGAAEGLGMALSHAAGAGHTDLVRWLLGHGRPDVHWKNYQGKTPLALARERGASDVAALLEAHGARE